MADIKDLVLTEVLARGYLMSLATVDSGGVWVSDVVYVHDDQLNIYWMSHPKTRHSQAITENAGIAGTITISNPGEDNAGIQFAGIAQKLEESRYDLVVKHFAKRNKPAPPETDDVLQGRSWYVLKPNKIELIYEKLFGFKKQELPL